QALSERVKDGDGHHRTFSRDKVGAIGRRRDFQKDGPPIQSRDAFSLTHDTVKREVFAAVGKLTQKNPRLKLRHERAGHVHPWGCRIEARSGLDLKRAGRPMKDNFRIPRFGYGDRLDVRRLFLPGCGWSE